MWLLLCINMPRIYRKKRASGAYKRKARKVAKSTKMYVKKVLDSAREDKYIDLSQTIAEGTAATDNAGSVVLLSPCSQGLTGSNRIGEVIMAKTLDFNFDCESWYNDGSVQITDTKFRVIVFQDRMIRSSTLPAVSDILETVAWNAPINRVACNTKRFRILMDKIFDLDPKYNNPTATQAVTNYTSQSSQMIRKHFKLRNKIVYSGASTSTQKNNVYVMYLSDRATAQAPSASMYSRITFEDA